MIDPTTFTHLESIWQDIFTCLKNAGFDVYSPSTQTGECTSAYVVVKNDGSTAHDNNISTDDDLYLIMVYVPKDNYSDLEVEVQKVKEAMKSLLPMVVPCGLQTSSYYDDDLKGHMVSISYKNYKKINRY